MKLQLCICSLGAAGTAPSSWGDSVLVLPRLHTLRVSRMGPWGCRVWEIRHGVILPCPLPCKVTSSSGCVKRLSRGSVGRGCRFPAGQR